MFCFFRPVVVVVVFFILTDRASTIPSNTRGCQSGTWSAGHKKMSALDRVPAWGYLDV